MTRATTPAADAASPPADPVSIAAPPATLDGAPVVRAAERPLLTTLILLALPILVENILHMAVGLTDVWLAGHLRQDAAAATAAIGTVAYILWFINLIASAVATGATAIVSRAIGGRHRSLANSVTGQAIGASALIGLTTAIVFALFAKQLADFTKLEGTAHEFARIYFQTLSFSLPFSMVTVAAGACLRGAGDTLTPAIAMVVVGTVNVALSYGLTRGAFGFPELGFKGIAIGTLTAYSVGGILLTTVLLTKGRPVRLHLHRLRPHWNTMRRLIRIGLPNGVEGGLTWMAQFQILRIVNKLDASNAAGAAHIVTIRIESLSYMLGLALMTATATLVGQSLGRKDPARATRVTWLAFALGAGVMLSWGVAFALAGRHLASFMTSDPAAIDLAAQCLFVTSFAQLGFAATLVFGGALRGAGDTLVVMIINIISQVGIRLVGVIILTQQFNLGLAAVWLVLGGELTLRGGVIFLRFLHGGWKHVKV